MLLGTMGAAGMSSDIASATPAGSKKDLRSSIRGDHKLTDYEQLHKPPANVILC